MKTLAFAFALLPYMSLFAATNEWFDANIANTASWPEDGGQVVVVSGEECVGVWDGTLLRGRERDGGEECEVCRIRRRCPRLGEEGEDRDDAHRDQVIGFQDGVVSTLKGWYNMTHKL